MKDHHLNEEDILQEFREMKGLNKLVDLPSFQGSRMNWMVEVACAILVNHEVYLDYLHRLRYCTLTPNKLVVAAYEGLSDHTAIAALAARSIFCVEVIDLAVFFTKALATRWTLGEFYDLVIGTIENCCPKGELASKMVQQFPEYEERIKSYVKSQSPKVKAVYDAAKAYDDQWPHFMAKACPAVLWCVKEHRDDCVKGQDLMRDGFVTSCFMESFFGVLKNAHTASSKVRVTNVCGVAAAIKSGTFLTQSERLREEQKRRKQCRLPAMTRDECVAFAEEDPLASWHSLDPETRDYLYKTSRGRWRMMGKEDCRLMKLQRQNRLNNKERLRLDKEARDSNRLVRYNEYLKYPVMMSMPEVLRELRSTHRSNQAAKYSIAMKVPVHIGAFY